MSVAESLVKQSGPLRNYTNQRYNLTFNFLKQNLGNSGHYYAQILSPRHNTSFISVWRQSQTITVR